MTIISTALKQSNTPSIEDIIGVPDWTTVSVGQLQQTPWRSICAVVISSSGQPVARGTGWLAGPRTVITAAHVIAAVAPGAGRSAAVTFPATGTIATTQSLEAHASFGGGTGVDVFDIAALHFPTDLGPPLSPFAFGLSSTTVIVAGFPFGPTDDFKTDSKDAVKSVLFPDLLLHRCDTLGGHSGSPVVIADGSGRVIGLHVHEDDANPDPGTGSRNVALLMRAELIAFIQGALDS